MSKPIESPSWLARRHREDRKAYLEAVEYCNKNIKDLWEKLEYNHMSDKSKRILAVDMLEAKKFMLKYEQKYESKLLEYKDEIDSILGLKKIKKKQKYEKKIDNVLKKGDNNVR